MIPDSVDVLVVGGGSVLDASDESTDPGGVVSRLYFVIPPRPAA